MLALQAQLRVLGLGSRGLELGGRLLAPVGDGSQRLVLLEKGTDGVERTELMRVRFVPMRGGE